jgi:preprotein translocase subunit SecE
MNNLAKTGIWVAAIGIVFVFLWLKGYLAKIADYVKLTWEELHKCSWPTWEELKGSTVVVAISLVILGGFTVGVDLLFAQVFSRL